jgi:site-specific recombinase XerD
MWAPRELRHTFVSVMSMSGVAVEEIARLAGHAHDSRHVGAPGPRHQP